MCTNEILTEKIRMYVEVSAEVSKLEKLKKELSAFILQEVDNRNKTADPQELDMFSGQKVITSRLNETATKEGRQFLKDNAGQDIDKYLNVSLSRYVNTAACKKI